MPSVACASLVVFLLCLCDQLRLGASQQESGTEQYGKVEKSCLNARIVTGNVNYFCDFATWTSAHLYTSSNFSYFAPGSPLSDLEQNNYAKYLYAKLSNQVTSSTGGGGGNSQHFSSDCKDTLKRLACDLSFPECALPGTSISSISYFPPCRLQCEQVNARCPFHLSCDEYPQQDCMMYVPSGYFVLSVAQGPYQPLPIVYGVVLGGWLLMTIAWNVYTFIIHKNRCVLLCRAVSGIPVVKCVVLIFGVSFWTTCVSWDMCSFWMGVSLINTHLVYETGEMVIFMLVAKGWSITRENFSANEWRGVIMSMSGFYMANSIILVLEASVLTSQGFWAASAVLYGIMYLYILSSVLEQLRNLRDYVSLLRPDMPEHIADPMRQKYCMYICFLFLVFASIAMEILTHALVVTDGRMWIVLLAYEVSNMIIIFAIGWIFRPREHSPYFFMVPARMNDATAANRPMPIIEVGEKEEEAEDEEAMDAGTGKLKDSKSGGERDSKRRLAVELAPLLPDSRGKLIVIRHPDRTCSIGTTAPIRETNAPVPAAGNVNALQIERAL